MAKFGGYYDEYRHVEPRDCGMGDPEFYEPGGNSALRAGKRKFPCPTCGKPNRLTAADVKLGYQCDTCADMQEFPYMGNSGEY